MRISHVRMAAIVLSLALTPVFASASFPESLSRTAQTYNGHGEVGTFRFGGTLGLDLASNWTGFAIRPQLSYTVSQLGSNLYFDLAGHFGLTLGEYSEWNHDWHYSGQIWEVVPALRLRWAVSNKVALYGDLGLGFAGHRIHHDYTGYTHTHMGAVLSFPLGMRIALSPVTDLVVQPAGFNVYFDNDGNSFHYSMLIGALFKI